MEENNAKREQNLLFRTEKTEPATMAGFTDLGAQRGQNRAKVKFVNMLYRPAEIYPENLDLKVSKWYVHYSYVNPETKKYERFKVYEDINRYKGRERVKYAERLRDAVNAMLVNGYNPYDEESKVKETVERRKQQLRREAAGDRSTFTILQALNFFIEKTKKSGKSPATLGRYTSHINLLKEWLNEKGQLLKTASEITGSDLLEFLTVNSDAKRWGGKTYNNYLGSLQVVFNFLAKRIHGVIPFNPLNGAPTKTTVSRKHTAYTDKQLSWILTAVRNAKDIYLEGIILTVYYACIRSKAELLAFKAGNILFDRDLIRLDAEGTKGRRDDFIPLDPVLKEFYLAHGIDKLPPTWFVFGRSGKPGPLRAGANDFSARFSEYRDALKLDDRYTLYGFKHTRIIHLAKAGVDPYALIVLTRHTTLDQLMAYLRDLGLTLNFAAVKDSRKL